MFVGGVRSLSMLIGPVESWVRCVPEPVNSISVTPEESEVMPVGPGGGVRIDDERTCAPTRGAAKNAATRAATR